MLGRLPDMDAALQGVVQAMIQTKRTSKGRIIMDRFSAEDGEMKSC